VLLDLTLSILFTIKPVAVVRHKLYVLLYLLTLVLEEYFDLIMVFIPEEV
jgi:hypothetical protein